MTAERHRAGGLRTLSALAITTFIAVIAMNLLHEMGHALTGIALGYDMVVNINSTGLASGGYRSAFDRNLVDFAGPAVTVLLAAGALVTGLKRRWMLPPVVVFVAMMMRILAAGASTISPNDEARIGLSLGIGFWTLHAVVVAVLVWMFVVIYQRYRLGWRWLLTAFVATSLAFTVIVFGEPLLAPIEL